MGIFSMALFAVWRDVGVVLYELSLAGLEEREEEHFPRIEARAEAAAEELDFLPHRAIATKRFRTKATYTPVVAKLFLEPGRVSYVLLVSSGRLSKLSSRLVELGWKRVLLVDRVAKARLP